MHDMVGWAKDLWPLFVWAVHKAIQRLRPLKSASVQPAISGGIVPCVALTFGLAALLALVIYFAPCRCSPHILAWWLPTFDRR